MRRLLPGVAAFALLACAPSPALAWGAAAHRLIMRRALALLPPAVAPFFAGHGDEVVLRANDPDLWRTAGWDDNANHFLDFGVPEYGAYPFTLLPRELGAAIEKFGFPTLKKNGLLPWRVEEEFGNLRRAFQGLGRGAPYAAGDVVLFAAVLGHYVQDAHQPLHATSNFDGQLTRQRGVHARFESALVERYEARLTLAPTAPASIADARDRAFEILLHSYTLVAPLLEADRQAHAGRTAYDDAYFDAFFARVKPVLERQLSDAITATAAYLAAAWRAAGQPALRAGAAPAR